MTKIIGVVLTGLSLFKEAAIIYQMIPEQIAGTYTNDQVIGNYQRLLDEVEAREEEIVAYKSPILSPPDQGFTSVTDLMNGKPIGSDIKFIGWNFFHPNLNHNKNMEGDGLFATLFRAIKNKIIIKASETSSKKRGGVNMLNRRYVKSETAYNAFYWYTYYTEDLEKDCFEKSASQGGEFVDSVIQTQNGSVVRVTTTTGETRQVFVADNMVKSGDWVVVDGVKYRVK